MNPPEIPLPPPIVSRRRLSVIAALVLLITAVADFLFWYELPGISLSIFVVILGGAVWGNKRAGVRIPAAIAVTVLLVGAAAQSAIEISFSNVLVTIALLVALTGESFYAMLPTGWPRWSEALWSFAKTPARWLRILATVSRSKDEARGVASLTLERTARLARICLPALALTVVFGMLLGRGNAIFGRWAFDSFDAFFKWLTHFDITFGRVFFWIVIAAGALPFVEPGRVPDHARWWTRDVPSLPAPRERAIRLWQSRLALALLNALFLAVNTIDAIYLWIHSAIPAGVTYSEFVHGGVFLLVVAVLLSAVVLVAIFQQADAIARERSLRVLALVWIGQNVVLVSSVLLRLKLYVEAYQLSTLRVYVALFLLLVTTGFVLLAIHVQRRRTLNWLIFTNALATFALFYCVQFADVANWVARYNVAQWNADRSRTLDVQYLVNLGPSAWPALKQIAETDGLVAHVAGEKLDSIRSKEAHAAVSRNWRSWQARHAHYAQELLSQPPR
ncbi:MAG: hypothetical protein QOD99_1125 [Chthoniobacter sp.]|jgi:hypothetical protein|nr:hypothetical protein [Chthoniobacter sp.]